MTDKEAREILKLKDWRFEFGATSCQVRTVHGDCIIWGFVDGRSKDQARIDLVTEAMNRERASRGVPQ